MTADFSLRPGKRLQHIQRSAKAMKWMASVCLVALVPLSVLLVLAVIFPAFVPLIGDNPVSIDNQERTLSELSLAQRGSLTVLLIVSLSLLTGALRALRCLFERIQNAEFFAGRTLDTMASLGIWLISYAIFDFASVPVSTLIATMDYPEGQRVVDVSADGGEIFCMILGTLMVLLGWVMREAASLAEENRQII
ncbi:DUF2975 domain-containing protein [Roseibium sp. SCP14]|uniref:DUF2975 domain-containing protein n=1 Tax=Roseibium sp. SCP14 TaxID=3141375 RepID=UPI00333D47C9